MPASPAALPASTACAKSPAWNARHASSTSASLGSGSPSPLCRRAQFFLRPAASYAYALSGCGNFAHFFAMASPVLKVVLSELLDQRAAIARKVRREQREHVIRRKIEVHVVAA